MHTFEKPGKENTAQTLDLALARAEALQIHTVLVATTTGRTALEATKKFIDQRVVVVTHSTGFSEAGVQEIDPGLLGQIKENGGGRILTATHAFGGVGRAVRRKFQTYQVDEVIAQTLRLFGQGTKVAVEIAIMAADAGLVPIDEDVISIGGSQSGADTALVLRPAHTQDLFDVKIQEIICKPYL